MAAIIKNVVIDEFEIPEELAKELSSLLTESSIKKALLVELVEVPAKYDIIENAVIILEDKITALKNMITREYVPNHYRSSEYSWNYDGYATAGRIVQIMK
jgi:hypothetical protein